ncbi:MAG TPA: hypothetical protein VGI40_22475 [Pirellulaceae bacterium]
MRYFTTIAIISVVSIMIGCTKPSSSTGQAAAQPTQAQATQPAQQPAAAPTQPVAVPSNATPDQVVTVFLNAMRSGDSPTTESLLTGKAREELAKHSLSVDVQSAPNATYQVHRAEILQDASGAHVRSVWTERFNDGDETYEIVWALRHQQEGWRVAGMAMELLPGQPMQFLNFEDPADMLHKKEQAIAALQAPAVQTAQQPQQPLAPAARTIER